MDTHHRAIDQMTPEMLDSARDKTMVEGHSATPAASQQSKLDELLSSAVEQARSVC